MARVRRRRSRPSPPGYGTPLSPRQQRAQVASLVNAQILPLIAQINAESARKAASGGAAITAYTDQLARRLAPLAGQTRATYQAAEQRQTADDTALANRLQGLGGDVAATLRQQVGGIGNADAFSNLLAGQASQQGAGAGAALAGMGTAAVGALRGAGAAAEAYSGQLPGISRIGGLQRLAQLRAQIESERASQVGDIRAKVPSLTATVSQQVADREFQRQVAIQSGLLDQAKFNADVAYKGAQLKLGAARVRQGARSLDLRAAKAQSDALFKQAGLNLRRDQYNLAVSREHRLQQTKSGKKGGFTPSQLSHLRATAIETAKDWKHGVPATHYANGQVKSRGSAGHPHVAGARPLFRFLVNHGIPPTMADWATGQVYGRWKAPGERSSRGPAGAGPR